MTALLAVSYLDRFLSSRTLPVREILNFVIFKNLLGWGPGSNFGEVAGAGWGERGCWVAGAAAGSSVRVGGSQDGGDARSAVIGSADPGPEIRIRTQNHYPYGAAPNVRPQLANALDHALRFHRSIRRFPTSRINSRVTCPLALACFRFNRQDLSR